MRNLLVTLGVAMAVLATATAADWPKFLGPDGNGVSPETGLAKAWPAEGPKELWKFATPEGFGSAAIQGGKVYFMERVADKQEVVRCLDLSTGKEEWNYSYDAPLPSDKPKGIPYPGARSTPLVEDKFVYTIGAVGDVLCIDKASHKPVWQKNVLKDFGGKVPQWGVAASPVAYEDMLILAPQSKTAGLAAVKKASGEVVWKSDPIGGMTYSTPLVTKVDGVDQAIQVSFSQVSGVGLKDGKVLWTFAMAAKPDDPNGWKVETAPIPSATDLGGGKYFLTGGYAAGSIILQVSRDGEKFSAKMLKKIQEVGSQLHNGLLYKGNIYVNGDNTNAGLVCLDTDGNVKWKTERSPGFDKGGFLIADGKVYIVGGNNGKVYMVEASPEAYKQLGVFQGLEGNKEIWSPLSLSDGKLVARDKKQYKCWDVSGK